MSNKLDGKAIAAKSLEQSRIELNNIKLRYGIKNPTLVVISIGDDDASKVYVRNKQRAAEQVGLTFVHKVFNSTAEFTEINRYIYECNYTPDIFGIIIQLPAVSMLSKNEIAQLTNNIAVSKDVDGFLLGSPFTPCTPKGIMELLDSIPNLNLSGKTALVIGRSNIVGKPIAKLLLDRNCTVIQAHSKTPKDTLCRMFSFADIVVSAVGKRDVLTTHDADQYWKDNRHDFYGDFHNNRDRVIIDVGINRDENGKLCGDFSESFKEEFSEFYTPVPGGVGPMTVAMLIKNTIQQ